MKKMQKTPVTKAKKPIDRRAAALRAADRRRGNALAIIQAEHDTATLLLLNTVSAKNALIAKLQDRIFEQDIQLTELRTIDRAFLVQQLSFLSNQNRRLQEEDKGIREDNERLGLKLSKSQLALADAERRLRGEAWSPELQAEWDAIFAPEVA